MPKDIKDLMQLTSIIEEYKSWIGGVFLVSGSISVINLIQGLFNNISRVRKKRKLMKRRQEKLRRLTPKEKLILVRYFALNTTSQDLPFNDGVVSELAAYGIITRSSILSSRGTDFPYNLKPWARDYLNRHPELLYVDEEEEMIIRREIEKENLRW